VDLVKPWSEGVFLYQCMGGKEVGQPGKGGVLEPTRFEHYQQFLGGGYRLVDRSRAYQPLRFEASSGGYDDALWVRKEPAQGGILKSPGRA
jgi:hypothetical protein